MKYYYFEFLGDLNGVCTETFSSKESALLELKKEWGWVDTGVITDRWGNKIGYGNKNGVSFYMPDPEDDRVLLWEVSEEGRKLVWHFSGWHWSFDAAELPGGPLDQGILERPGTYFEGKSLYELAMRDY